MKYLYSESLGIIISDKGYETPDKAKIAYFKNTVFLLNDRIRKSKENILKNEKLLDKLKIEFRDLCEKYPEDLI